MYLNITIALYACICILWTEKLCVWDFVLYNCLIKYWREYLFCPENQTLLILYSKQAFMLIVVEPDTEDNKYRTHNTQEHNNIQNKQRQMLNNLQKICNALHIVNIQQYVRTTYK